MHATPNPEIEALIAAFYAAFDNRAGRAPDAVALRALFTDGATITRAAPGQAETWSAEAFIAPRVAMLTDGALQAFHEWEVTAQTTVLASTASRWSTFKKLGVLNGAPYRGGGHKFILMHRQAGRWRIASILWEDL